MECDIETKKEEGFWEKQRIAFFESGRLVLSHDPWTQQRRIILRVKSVIPYSWNAGISNAFMWISLYHRNGPQLLIFFAKEYATSKIAAGKITRWFVYLNQFDYEFGTTTPEVTTISRKRENFTGTRCETEWVIRWKSWEVLERFGRNKNKILLSDETLILHHAKRWNQWGTALCLILKFPFLTVSYQQEDLLLKRSSPNRLLKPERQLEPIHDLHTALGGGAAATLSESEKHSGIPNRNTMDKAKGRRGDVFGSYRCVTIVCMPWWMENERSLYVKTFLT